MRPYFTILALLVCLSVKGMDGTFGNMTAGSATAQTSFTSTGGTTNLNANVVGTNTSTGAHWMIGTNAHMWLVDKFGTKFTYFTNYVSVVWTNGAYGYWTNNGDGTCDMRVNGKVYGNGLTVTNAATFLGGLTANGLTDTNTASHTIYTNALNAWSIAVEATGGIIISNAIFPFGYLRFNPTNSSESLVMGATNAQNGFQKFFTYSLYSGTSIQNEGLAFSGPLKVRALANGGRTIQLVSDNAGGSLVTVGSGDNHIDIAPGGGAKLSLLSSNIVAGTFVGTNTITATNGFLLPTNFSATAFAPVAGLTKLIGSNNAVYVVGIGYTNVVVADH